MIVDERSDSVSDRFTMYTIHPRVGRDFASNPPTTAEMRALLDACVVGVDDVIHPGWAAMTDKRQLWDHAMVATNNQLQSALQQACEEGKFKMIRNAGASPS